MTTNERTVGRYLRWLLAALSLGAGVILNAGILGVWVMSRVWGAPFGPDPWTPEDVFLADALSSGFELGIVALTAAVLVRPAVAQRELGPKFAVPVVAGAGVGVAVVASLAFTPALASSHDDHAGGRNE